MGSNSTPDSVSFAFSEIHMTVSFYYFPDLRFITREKSDDIPIIVRMADWSKAPDSRLRNLPLLKLSILVH